MATLPDLIGSMFLEGLDSLLPYFQPSAQFAVSTKSGSGRKSADWISEYTSSCCGPAFPHDEPWLTIMAMYGLLGDQQDLAAPARVQSVNRLFAQVFRGKSRPAAPPVFASLDGGRVEVCLPENPLFRDFLKRRVFSTGAYHPYADRCNILKDKLAAERSSLEGSTNLDALIYGRQENGLPANVFIEAKFLSDVSKDISYLPVRNQIARNIDCALDIMTDHGKNMAGLQQFWFVLLTPGMFRTPAYGGPVSTVLDLFTPCRSRLYCYKMDDYTDINTLKSELPHWDLHDSQWQQVSARIGWLTFEDVVRSVTSNRLLSCEQLEAFRGFFSDRGISEN